MISDNIKGISGLIAGINLSSFLQMIEEEAKCYKLAVDAYIN